MLTRTIRIVNPLGLHARAAARFVRLASQFGATVRVARGARELDGKSILGLLLLGASRGTEITIRTEGADAEAALEALSRLVADGFDDE
jgi:phosphocarrier protein HPr